MLFGSVNSSVDRISVTVHIPSSIRHTPLKLTTPYHLLSVWRFSYFELKKFWNTDWSATLYGNRIRVSGPNTSWIHHFWGFQPILPLVMLLTSMTIASFPMPPSKMKGRRTSDCTALKMSMQATKSKMRMFACCTFIGTNYLWPADCLWLRSPNLYGV